MEMKIIPGRLYRHMRDKGNVVKVLAYFGESQKVKIAQVDAKGEHGSYAVSDVFFSYAFKPISRLEILYREGRVY